MNRYNNMLNLSYESVWFYNDNFRLTVLVDGSWSIRDLEANIFQYESELLDNF